MFFDILINTNSKLIDLKAEKDVKLHWASFSFYMFSSMCLPGQLFSSRIVFHLLRRMKHRNNRQNLTYFKLKFYVIGKIGTVYM